MFLGTSNHTLDDKFRLVLPRKDREIFGTKVIVTLGFDHNLALYTAAGFAEFIGELDKVSNFDANARRVKRVIFGHSADLNVDAHGRVILPRALLECVGITRDVTLVGTGDHIEVWDTATFEANRPKDEEDLSCLAQTFLEPDRR